MFINDMTEIFDETVTCKHFADDVKIYSMMAPSPVLLQRQLTLSLHGQRNGKCKLIFRSATCYILVKIIRAFIT